jgi:hypothetical protein
MVTRKYRMERTKDADLPLSFLTFSIELYVEHTHIPSPKVYRLFVKTILLDIEWDFLAKNDENDRFWKNFFTKYADTSKMKFKTGEKSDEN